MRRLLSCPFSQFAATLKYAGNATPSTNPCTTLRQANDTESVFAAIGKSSVMREETVTPRHTSHLLLMRPERMSEGMMEMAKPA
jgi:hypothetical protein